MRASKTAAAVIALALTAPLATTQHTVRPGDTLSGIAAAHGTTVGALAAANGLGDPDHIVAGQVLQIGGGGGASGAAPAGAGAVHTVARGETLSAIAAAYGTTVGALAAANSIANPHHIVAGTRLRVAGGGAGAAPAPAATVHTVAAGETLSAIARRYGVTAAAIVSQNGLTNPDLVRIGQRLQISAGAGVAPARPASGGSFPARLLARPERLALVPSFDKWAAHYGVPHDLLKAMTWLESGWQNHVVSSTGAVGIGQLMPATVDFVRCCLIGAALDPSVPDHNIRMSARFLRYLLDEQGGDASLALASYYQGLRAVRERGVYAQTHAYVAGVLSFRDGYGWR